MQITIELSDKIASSIKLALAQYHGILDISDSELANFVSMDLDIRYENILENNGFEDEISTMLDELEDYFM